MIVSPLTLAGLCAAAFVAGTIDAIAGGGGLISLPALLTAGVPVGVALATNKGQSTFGTASALVHYWRAGAVDRRRAPIAFALGLSGAALGAYAVTRLRPSVLEPLVLTLLAGVALLLAFRRNLGVTPSAVPKASPVSWFLRAGVIAVALGFYDGFFGPGTGTFLIVASIAWLGDSMSSATANAKVVNLASNLAALTVFSAQHLVRWDIALPMALCQILGGALGARLAVRRGDRFVRGVVLIVTLALVLRLGLKIAGIL